MQDGNLNPELMMRLLRVLEDIQAQQARVAEQMQGNAARMDASVRDLQGGAEDFAQQVVQAISAQAPQALAQGMGQAVGQYEERIQRGAEQAKWAGDALGEQRKLLTRAQSALVWKGLIALALGLVGLGGGMSYLAYEKLQEFEQSSQAVEATQVLQTQTLVRCGTGWCVKVPPKGAQHYGAHGEYVQIAP